MHGPQLVPASLKMFLFEVKKEVRRVHKFKRLHRQAKCFYRKLGKIFEVSELEPLPTDTFVIINPSKLLASLQYFYLCDLSTPTPDKVNDF